MVDHQSKEVVDKMSDELKIQPAMALPRQIVNSIQPVYNVNPLNRENIARTASRGTTGTTTILAIPTDRPFFLTSAHLNFQCNATANSTAYSITITPFGAVNTHAIRIGKLTTTATTLSESITYINGLRLEPGSLISINQTFTVGASIITGGFTGFTTDPQ